jgi:hypothetical protein
LPETLVPEGAVNEFLGIKSLPRRFGVNILIVNWNGRRLLDRGDVLRWLQANADSLDSSLIRKLHDELADITAKETDK